MSAYLSGLLAMFTARMVPILAEVGKGAPDGAPTHKTRASYCAPISWPLLPGRSFVYVSQFNKKGVIRMAEKSAIQRIKDLDAERATIFDQAKEEALEKAKVAVAELNALGLNYTLTAGPRAKAASVKGKRTIKAEACPICEFQTSPPHDGRTHRSQKRKAAFSAAELKEKGLVKV
jgi:hypothetical protein